MFFTYVDYVVLWVPNLKQCGSKVDLVNAAYGDAFDEFQGLREDRWVHSADAGEIWFINEEFRKSSKDILRFW